MADAFFSSLWRILEPPGCAGIVTAFTVKCIETVSDPELSADHNLVDNSFCAVGLGGHRDTLESSTVEAVHPTGGRQSTTIPPVRFATAPVIGLQRSEATKAATSAISATVGNCLRRVNAD